MLKLAAAWNRPPFFLWQRKTSNIAIAFKIFFVYDWPQ